MQIFTFKYALNCEYKEKVISKLNFSSKYHKICHLMTAVCNCFFSQPCTFQCNMLSQHLYNNNKDQHNNSNDEMSACDM